MLQDNWFVYIVECSDGSLYTGSTKDVERRVKEHSAGKGARYTRARRPVTLILSFQAEDKSTAFKEEYRIKQMSRQKKLEFIETFQHAQGI
jgi:putative endonuclease